MELSQSAKNSLLSRFPKVELSYEIYTHKKVSQNYDIGIAIPNGKKCFIWFTFHKDKDVCYLLELNRDKKICSVFQVYTCFHYLCSKGTILYGTWIQEQTEKDQIESIHTQKQHQEMMMMQKKDYNYFVIDDMFYYKGMSLKNMLFQEKLKYIDEFCKKMVVDKFDAIENCPPNHLLIVCVLAGMWPSYSIEEKIPEEFIEELAYTIHHIQYRDSAHISPHMNLSLNKKNVGQPSSISIPKHILMKQTKNSDHRNSDHKNINKPQYKHPAVFVVSADIQYDIYYLYAYCSSLGSAGSSVSASSKSMDTKEMHTNRKDNDAQEKDKDNLIYYNVAYIPDYKTSVFMNNIFRKIKANSNLDVIEESEDEAEFGDLRPDKYVDLDKYVKIECVFHPKFRKWVPKKVVDEHSFVVNISKL